MSDDLIYNLKLSLSEEDLKHQFFFDASDVIHILKGVNLFYDDDDSKKFKRSTFTKKIRIVQALAYGGYLSGSNPINLLPPHQAELIELLDQNIISNLYSARLLEELWKKDLRLFENLKKVLDDNTVNYIEELDSEKGETIIKAIFASYKLTWQERFYYLLHEKQLLKLAEYSISDILVNEEELELFDQLLKSLSGIKHRQDKSDNNYRDALALVYLARKVKLFNNGKIDYLPVFFDSQTYLDNIPSHILAEHFTFINLNQSLALRQSNYFKIYALLKSNLSFPDEDSKYREFMNSQKFFLEAKSTLKNLNYRKGYSNSDNLINSKNLEDQIINYFDYDFFKTIILNTFSKDQILNSIFDNMKLDHISYDAFQKIKNQIDETLLKIDKKINYIIDLSSRMFGVLESRVIYLQGVFYSLVETNRPLDVFYHYSLFRFFIPKNSEINLRKLFSPEGLLSEHSNTNRESMISLWSYHAKMLHNGSLNEDRTFLLFASFWILNLHQYIAELPQKVDGLHHSLLMLWGACIHREIMTLQRENRSSFILQKKYHLIIFELEKRKIDVELTHKSAFGELRIALSYLYFHLWIHEGGELLLERNNNINISSTIDSNYIAIKYAKEALNFFQSTTNRDSKLRVYALNIYIYFIIDSASDEEFYNIEEERSEFIGLRGGITNWHFRYDDTIARNFHRLSLLVVSKSRKLEYIGIAVDLLKKSLLGLKNIEGRDIKEVETYLLVLQNLLGDLESQD